ncbi:MAG: 5-(carboxyamino)imidazole ribonucleotide synthase [Verrucomicrobiaceae bacterium]|nr:5-(carboxyamino)imidazole ribonucleotide synthase [Verrucomicrobiaceae bacterium]
MPHFKVQPDPAVLPRHKSSSTKRRKRPALGIIGGGQLARMMAQSGVSLGCDVIVLDPDPNAPAAAAATRSIHKAIRDLDALDELARSVDVVALENEFIDATILSELEVRGHCVLPGSETMRRVQDKLFQKNTIERAGLPLPPFASVSSRADVIAAGWRFGWPIVLKQRRDGYDGRGNATIRSAAEVDAAWARLDGARHPLYVEAFCPFVRELAVAITIAHDGSVARYPLVETVQQDHICHSVVAPAEVPEDVARRAGDVALRAVQAVGAAGTFAVELFLCEGGEVMVNEIAPRVHNSGHYTIDACECSQFENHIRALMGWPLGSTAMRAPAAAMVNLLGRGEGSGAPLGVAACLAVPEARLHLYGKSRTARGRKMGHVTATGATPEEALRAASLAASFIQFGDPS